MKKCIDLTGQVYGSWSVITSTKTKGVWLCRCVCGTQKEVKSYNLQNGLSKNCGCARRLPDFTGRTFGRWTVLHKIQSRPGPRDFWLCRCSCGTEKEVYGIDLRRGKSVSCGCYRKECVSKRRTTHGESQLDGARAKEYRAWKAMKTRCSNPNQPGWVYYGKVHVIVAREWLTDFEAFFAHIGPSPSAKHSVDRIDPWGDYTPGNVRWATMKEQRMNQRQHHPKSVTAP